MGEQELRKQLEAAFAGIFADEPCMSLQLGALLSDADHFGGVSVEGSVVLSGCNDDREFDFQFSSIDGELVFFVGEDGDEQPVTQANIFRYMLYYLLSELDEQEQ